MGRSMPSFDPKRLTDLVLSGLALIVLAPVLAAVALAVAVALGRPVLFRQVRPGLGGKPFRLIKFRTMLDAVGADGKPLADSRRLTRFGRFLRATSLDELPELWNVLRGDMSLVGPRPLLTHYLPLYSPEQARRHEVRPGLTGWAQVNGRNALSWTDKLALDSWYVDHRSFRLDMRILAMTVAKVLSRTGIAAEGSDTMPEFRGNEPPSTGQPELNPTLTAGSASKR
jgi:lipopolysaccharide/colanic/teichoic acid biosynthesis glycosyltransferase